VSGWCVAFSMLWTYIVVSVLNKLNSIPNYIPYDNWVSYVNQKVIPDPSDPSRRQLLYSVVVNFIADLFGKTIDYNEGTVKYIFAHSKKYRGCDLISNMFGPDNNKLDLGLDTLGPNRKNTRVVAETKKQDQDQEQYRNKDFLEVIIPMLLEDIPNYYITGERAYDYYFVDKIGSIVYDIIISESSYNTLYAKLLKYADVKGYTLNKPIMPVKNLFFTENGKPVMFGNGNVFMYCHIQDIPGSAYIVCNKLNYVTLTNLANPIFDEQNAKQNAKQIKQTNQVLKISWQDLSDDYKKCILSSNKLIFNTKRIKLVDCETTECMAYMVYITYKDGAYSSKNLRYSKKSDPSF
jgi:hypothetical protein